MKLRIARKVLYGRAADPAQPWLRIVRTHRWITMVRTARRLWLSPGRSDASRQGVLL